MTAFFVLCDQWQHPTRVRHAKTARVFAFNDGSPSAVGHALILPKRHVGRLAELTEDEYTQLWAVARMQLQRLDKAGCGAYTVRINAGAAASQTIAHVHLHSIPHIVGDVVDVVDAHGGIRRVLPDTAPYGRVPPA